MKTLHNTLLPILLFSMSTYAETANNPPTVKITSPETGSRFKAGEEVLFDCSAIDLEDGRLEGGSLVWTSDIDHYIGEGRSFRRKLSKGYHIIILTARDSDKQESVDSVFITIDGQKPDVPEAKKPAGTAKADKDTKLELTYVPPYGSDMNLRGKLLNGDPDKFGVAVYIMVEDAWWTKPYWAAPITEINSDGLWECDITTGGLDQKATSITAFLLPAGYEPPMASGNHSLPRWLDENSACKIEASRSPSGKVTISDRKKEKDGRLWGVCYGPFRDRENPDKGVFPSDEELKADIEMIPKLARAVRTYSLSKALGSIPKLCERAGLDCYPGAWLGNHKSDNDTEVRELIRIGLNTHQYSDNIEYKVVVEEMDFPASLDPTSNGSSIHQSLLLTHVKGLIVGNEVLLRGDMTEDELISYIREVKKTGVPVTSADVWSVWAKHPNLYGEVDFVIIHIDPYREGVSIDEAALHVMKVWRYMSSMFSSKLVVIGETGWPSDGKQIRDAVPRPENQARFFKEFTEMAEKEGIPYFLNRRHTDFQQIER